ncbi:MAG TPA: HPr(Ser) kinase/phosphatase [Gammaproteobacteria bacterium]|nr:HPr(Ser) kinase/phosphatase [Gammaproteobacteria bacterium]
MKRSTIGTFIQAVAQRLEISWVAGIDGSDTPLLDGDEDSREKTLVGSLNFIHPNRIQLIGHAELGYLDRLAIRTRTDTIRQLFISGPAAVICTDGMDVPGYLIEAADSTDTPLLASPADDQRVLNNLQYFLAQELAERETMHGVFLEILGIGVLLTGMVAVGKSELALELVARGHRLIADDAPEFARIAPDIVCGSCPPLLQDFIEVRGLGLLNARSMFGDTAIKRSKYLRLIIHLARFDDESLAKMDRLTGSYSTRHVLGLEIPLVTIPVAPGRNMAILMETAVRNYILRQAGYDASEDFVTRQRIAIEETAEEEET